MLIMSWSRNAHCHALLWTQTPLQTTSLQTPPCIFATSVVNCNSYTKPHASVSPAGAYRMPAVLWTNNSGFLLIFLKFMHRLFSTCVHSGPCFGTKSLSHDPQWPCVQTTLKIDFNLSHCLFSWFCQMLDDQCFSLSLSLGQEMDQYVLNTPFISYRPHTGSWHMYRYRDVDITLYTSLVQKMAE